jgi:hypothetical protein
MHSIRRSIISGLEPKVVGTVTPAAAIDGGQKVAPGYPPAPVLTTVPFANTSEDSADAVLLN